MHDVADKVGDLGTIGAIAAALAALALSCRMRGPKLNPKPADFPKDGSAELKKYENAFLQLSAKSREMEIGDRAEFDSAAEYALRAYEVARGAESAMQASPKITASKPVQMDIQKPSKSKLMPKPKTTDLPKMKKSKPERRDGD